MAGSVPCPSNPCANFEVGWPGFVAGLLLFDSWIWSRRLVIPVGRTIEWRKKWERNWDEVRYCSDRCRKRKIRPVDRELEAAIQGLLEQRGNGKTICPSEAAQVVGGTESEAVVAQSHGTGADGSTEVGCFRRRRDDPAGPCRRSLDRSRAQSESGVSRDESAQRARKQITKTAAGDEMSLLPTPGIGRAAAEAFVARRTSGILSVTASPDRSSSAVANAPPTQPSQHSM